MKLSNLLIKLFSVLSSLVEIIANLYRLIRDFIISTVKTVKNHFSGSNNNKNG